MRPAGPSKLLQAVHSVNWLRWSQGFKAFDGGMRPAYAYYWEKRLAEYLK